MTTMLYKSPGREQIWGVSVDYEVVDEDQVDAKLAEGWNLTVHGAEQDAEDRAAAKLAENEAEQARIAAEIEAAEKAKASGKAGGKGAGKAGD